MRYDKGALRGLGGYGTLGLEIVLSILLGLFGGRWLDGRFGTEPWLSVVGFFFGAAAAVRAIQRVVRDMRRETEREEREQGNPRPLWESPSDRAARLEERRRRRALDEQAGTLPTEPAPDEHAPTNADSSSTGPSPARDEGPTS